MTQITITAKEVAELRARTGAGMMDCKRALEEAGGDMNRAVEILRTRGITKADKRGGRATSQGLAVGRVVEDGSRGAILELTCETDFVALTEEFGRAADQLLDHLLASTPMPLEQFLAQPTTQGTVAEVVKAISAKTGESVALRTAVQYTPGAMGTVGLYLHHNRLVGVLVELLAGSAEAARSAAAQELARELAIHIASANPIAVRGEDIAADVLERERRIAEEQVATEGKPENIRAKIVEGKLRKFIAEQTLLGQPWVKDDKKPVKQLVEEAAKALGTSVSVTRFIRVRVGES
jgi:elongation factor Ts